MSNAKFGFVSWDDPPANQRQFTKFDNSKRIPFMKLKDGSNVVRMVTEPAVYFQARMPAQNGQGDRIRTAYPAHDDCPAKKAGLAPKRRYMVGVIDRSDGVVKILDMSSQIFDIITSWKDDVEVGGRATNFDINIKRNSKAPPASFYTALPRPASALSESDRALVDGAREELASSLERLTTPVSVDRCLEQMKKAGYTGGVLVEPRQKKEKEEKSAELADASEDDYSFEQPAV